jgi:hypothetical protein
MARPGAGKGGKSPQNHGPVKRPSKGKAVAKVANKAINKNKRQRFRKESETRNQKHRGEEDVNVAVTKQVPGLCPFVRGLARQLGVSFGLWYWCGAG